MLIWCEFVYDKNFQDQVWCVCYGLMVEWVQVQGICYLIFGYMFDDQVEIFLMQVVWGVGVDGLFLMGIVVDWYGVMLLWLLLGYFCDDLCWYLVCYDIDWVDDLINDDEIY